MDWYRSGWLKFYLLKLEILMLLIKREAGSRCEHIIKFL